MFFCCFALVLFFIVFFFNDTATTEIYTLSLHDALPISAPLVTSTVGVLTTSLMTGPVVSVRLLTMRSEEHTSELQSRQYLVCRLLLEKKNNLNHQRWRRKERWLLYREPF